jgi:hypothetical protein
MDVTEEWGAVLAQDREEEIKMLTVRSWSLTMLFCCAFKSGGRPDKNITSLPLASKPKLAIILQVREGLTDLERALLYLDSGHPIQISSLIDRCICLMLPESAVFTFFLSCISWMPCET